MARRETVLREVESELMGSGHYVVPFDLADSDSIPAMVLKVAETFSGLDSLVHAAGEHSLSPLRAVASADVRSIFEINVTTAFMLAKAFRHKMVRKESGSLVLLSSVAGVTGQPGVSAYSATKGAIASLTRALAIELVSEKVRVNCVTPGVVATSMTEKMHEQVGTEAWEKICQAHPLGLGEAIDVANAILYLVSPVSRWVTGTSLVVDGGYTAQ